MEPAFSLRRRSCGVLLHPTSLPGPAGTGDLGPAAEAFAGFLARAGQLWWQMLPVGPPGCGDSPYHSSSAFAGSPLLVSLELLAEQGLLGPPDPGPRPPALPGRADYDAALRLREPRLREAFARFGRGRRPEERRAYRLFRERRRPWLDDFALFAAIKRSLGGLEWTLWPAPLRNRVPAALKAAGRGLAAEVEFNRFVQFQFHVQWERLRRACREKGIGLIGDVPIFVSHDSADVWSRRELFHLDGAGRPAVVAGVPPDYFSRTGQRWGNPLYRWPVLRREGYGWWIERLAAAFERFDAVRLDHFIGFVRYWEIPAGDPTAERGRWLPGPGPHFFETILRELGPCQLIAEDLGAMGEDVAEVRDRFGFPGMRVLQFSFGGGPETSSHRPDGFPENCVVYTGTHDNDTVAGWFRAPGADAAGRRDRETALRILGTDGREIHWDMIRLAYASAAGLAVIPAQDILGLGSEARMNFPGKADGNWRWRLESGALGDAAASRLADLARACGRDGKDG